MQYVLRARVIIMATGHLVTTRIRGPGNETYVELEVSYEGGCSFA